MCQRIVCSNCQKYTWKGCGKHIEQVLQGLVPEQRCVCDIDRTMRGGSRQTAKGGKGV
jgi:hypothetical protein